MTPASRIFIPLVLLVLSLGLQAKTYKIMPLGDSITQGWTFAYMPPGRQASYRQSLWLQLQAARLDIDFVGTQNHGYDLTPRFDTYHEGYRGITSQVVASNMTRLLYLHRPDIVLLHIGTNDWGTNTSHVTTSLNLVDQYERSTGRHVKVILAQIINSTIYESWIRTYNSYLQSLVNTRNAAGDDVALVDMERGAGLVYVVGADFADYLHPNASGYAKMASVWFGVIETYIGNQDDDGDGYLNKDDAFPDDPGEWEDTDADGIGNNRDSDDDGDGLSDDVEIEYGLDPLDGTDALGDEDGDGITNKDEIEHGLDPWDDSDANEDDDGDGISNGDEIAAGTYEVNCTLRGLRNRQGGNVKHRDLCLPDDGRSYGFVPFFGDDACSSVERVVQGTQVCSLAPEVVPDLVVLPPRAKCNPTTQISLQGMHQCSPVR
jgi:lysophospholipase L1-like esterase